MNSKKLNQQIAQASNSAQQTPKKEEIKKEKKDDDYVPYTIQCEIFRYYIYALIIFLFKGILN